MSLTASSNPLELYIIQWRGGGHGQEKWHSYHRPVCAGITLLHMEVIITDTKLPNSVV